MYLLCSSPELRKTSQRCRAVENRCVFSAGMKAYCDSSGARSAGGRQFQMVGALTANLRCHAAVRTRGTSRIRLDAERPCRRGRGTLPRWKYSVYPQTPTCSRRSTAQINRQISRQIKVDVEIKSWGRVFKYIGVFEPVRVG